LKGFDTLAISITNQAVPIMFDTVDKFNAEWKSERPDLDISPMNVVGRILRLSKILEARGNSVMKAYQLQFTELHVLASIRRKGKDSQQNVKQLIESVLLSSGAMTACLDRLERKDLIKRIQDPNDKRGRLIVLTKKGAELIDKAIEIWFAEADRSLTGLTKKEQGELAVLLSKIF
jgi:DNA-binding MarR family transcriptional regulator